MGPEEVLAAVRGRPEVRSAVDEVSKGGRARAIDVRGRTEPPIYTQETRSSYVVLRDAHLHPPGTEPVLPRHRWRRARSDGRRPIRWSATQPHKGNPTLHGETLHRASPPGRPSRALGAKPCPTPVRSVRARAHIGDRTGATVRGLTEVSVGDRKCSWDTARTALFAQYSRTSRRSTWDAKRAPGHGWSPVGSGGATDRAAWPCVLPGTLTFYELR